MSHCEISAAEWAGNKQNICWLPVKFMTSRENQEYQISLKAVALHWALIVASAVAEAWVISCALFVMFF